MMPVGQERATGMIWQPAVFAASFAPSMQFQDWRFAAHFARNWKKQNLGAGPLIKHGPGRFNGRQFL